LREPEFTFSFSYSYVHPVSAGQRPADVVNRTSGGEMRVPDL